MIEQALRLVGEVPAGRRKVDRMRWAWALRDSGLLGRLKQVELMVLWMAFSMSDAHGEADLPVRDLAKRLGRSRRAVGDAVASLVELSLLECVGWSEKHEQVKRYRLAEVGAGQPSLTRLGKRGDSEGVPEADRGTCVPRPGNVRSKTGERAFPQRYPEREKESSKGGRAAAAGFSRGGGEAVEPAGPGGQTDGRPSALPERSLFEPPGSAGYDAMARRWLVRFLGIDARMANGLVGHYRPTRGQVRALVCNVLAKRGTDDPVRNVSAFVRRAMQEGNWSMDKRVLERKDKRLRDRRRRAGEQAAQRQARLERERSSDLAARRDRAAARVDAMSADAREEILRGIAERDGMNLDWLMRMPRQVLIAEFVEQDTSTKGTS